MQAFCAIFVVIMASVFITAVLAALLISIGNRVSARKRRREEPTNPVRRIGYGYMQL